MLQIAALHWRGISVHSHFITKEITRMAVRWKIPTTIGVQHQEIWIRLQKISKVGVIAPVIVT